MLQLGESLQPWQQKPVIMDPDLIGSYGSLKNNINNVNYKKNEVLQAIVEISYAIVESSVRKGDLETAKKYTRELVANYDLLLKLQNRIDVELSPIYSIINAVVIPDDFFVKERFIRYIQDIIFDCFLDLL